MIIEEIAADPSRLAAEEIEAALRGSPLFGKAMSVSELRKALGVTQ